MWCMRVCELFSGNCLFIEEPLGTEMIKDALVADGIEFVMKPNMDQLQPSCTLYASHHLPPPPIIFVTHFHICEAITLVQNLPKLC